MTKQEKLVELLDALAIKAEDLASQARGLKSIVEIEFTEDHLLDSVEVDDWRKSVLTLLKNTDLFSSFLNMDAKQVNEFLTQQLKDQVNAESSIESKI